MTKDEFASYLRALQAHDYETIKQHYTHDYRAHFDGATFDRDGVIAVERMLAAVADSSWDVLDVVADENAVAVHAILEMRFKKDAPPDFALGPFKAGERVKTRFCGFYKLRGGKICEFRVFPFLGEKLA
jgi:ketosteroid isomerase-like protein